TDVARADGPDVLVLDQADEPVTPGARAEEVPEEDEDGERHARVNVSAITAGSGADAVLLRPVVYRVVVEVVEERIDVRGPVGAEVDEVGVLVDVERDERRRVPHGERVLRVADVVEEPALVPVVGRPRPPPAAHAGG